MTAVLTNFREVGGAGAQAGRTRVIYRSNTEDVGSAAYPLRLDAVVDLRRPDEIAALQHPLAELPGYRAAPLFDPLAGPEAAATAIELEEQYIDWLERHRRTIAEVFRTIAATRGAVLVCCSAGKDRTGVVSAIMSDLWGLPLDVIAADYAASGPALHERFEAEWAVSADPERTRINQRCVPEIAEAVIRHIDREYGGAEGYLRAIGVSGAEIDSLR